MSKVNLYVNTTKDAAKVLSDKVLRQLLTHGHQITERCADADIVIGFGGDGTLLQFLRDNNYTVSAKYIGVNCGTLGFLQDFEVWDEALFVYSIPSLCEQFLRFIKIQIDTGREILNFEGLNEISVEEEKAKTYRACMRIDDEVLQDFVGTGIIFSTPTGSTAHNLSAGGCILHSNLEVIQITPREAIVNKEMHSLAKSLCVPSTSEIVLQPKLNGNIKVFSDGEQVYAGIYKEAKICYSDGGLTKLRSQTDNFIRTIREKLI